MTATATATNNIYSDDQLVKSQRKSGQYVNSFNSEFRLPNFTTLMRFLLSKNNTNLPADPKELDKSLPVIQHKKSEILKDGPGLRFIWIGHASCLVQMDDFIFLTDPVFSERCGVSPQIGPKRYRPPALTVNDLPDKLEVVVISHNHYDHLDYPTVRNLHKRYGNALTWFCGRDGGQWFRSCQIENVVELDWWEHWTHPVWLYTELRFLFFFHSFNFIHLETRTC